MKKFSKTWRGLGIAGLILAALTLLGLRNVDWFLLKKSLRHKFANVEWISTSDLADWLANKQRPAPVLLDVRTPEEWDVSHLSGARRIEPGASADKAASNSLCLTPRIVRESRGRYGWTPAFVRMTR